MKCIEDEIPFELPEGWAWTRISTVALFIGGYAYKSSKYVPDSQNILIRIGNIKNNSINPFVAKTCISDEYALETDSYLIRENDILFTMTGTRGKRDYFYSCKIEKRDLEGLKLFLNQRVGCLRLVSTADILPSYFVNAIQSSSVLEAIFATETGNVNQGNIGSTATLNLLIPVAPTEEQYKIQEKSLSILSAIEQYDIDSEDLSTIINKTRTKILDLAIRGQLVPQNPDDESASVLLERIRAEKEELIRQGKIKRDKKESIIFKGEDNSYYLDEFNEVTLPFDIPDNWIWVSHNELYEISGGSQPPKSKFSDVMKENYVRLYQIRDYGEHPVPVYIPEKLASKKTKKGDILLARYGASLGKVFWAEDGAYNVAMAKVEAKFLNGILPEYMFYFYHSRIYKECIFSVSRTAQAGFNKEDLNNLYIPLPPLEEQKRIILQVSSVLSKLDIISNTLL